MKKIKIKKMWLPIALVIVVAFLGVIAVWSIQKNNSDMLKEDESSIISSTSELTSTPEKKQNKTTTKATTEKQIEVETKETEATTKYVAPVTTKKQENTTSSVSTTKAPKPVATTKPAKPTTTKAPKDEYYPALTASDMEYLKQYAADYIESKGYTHNPDLDWDNCGYSSTVGISSNLAVYGEEFKVSNGGITPLEWAKCDIKSRVDGNIKEFGEDSPWLEMNLLIRETKSGGWTWTVGYMA